MEHTPSDRNADAEFKFVPFKKVIGIIDDTADAGAAIRDLRAAGFTADEVEVLAGEAGALRIDVTAEGREALVHTLPPTEKLRHYFDAPGIVSRIEEALQAGRYGVAVTAGESEGRERARAILKSHGGHFINFYGPLAAESLDP
jgi:uncharacterized protein (DUF2126 family)